MKIIDLSKLSIEMLDGTIMEYDFAKELAQVIFQNTQNINEHSFSVDLYKDPVVELNDENKRIIKEYTDKYFKAFVQITINKLLDGDT